MSHSSGANEQASDPFLVLLAACWTPHTSPVPFTAEVQGSSADALLLSLSAIPEQTRDKQQNSPACEVNSKDHCVLGSTMKSLEVEGSRLLSYRTFIRSTAALCTHSELCSACKTGHQIHVNPIG